MTHVVLCAFGLVCDLPVQQKVLRQHIIACEVAVACSGVLPAHVPRAGMVCMAAALHPASNLCGAAARPAGSILRTQAAEACMCFWCLPTWLSCLPLCASSPHLAGSILRTQVAEVCVAALVEPSASGKVS